MFREETLAADQRYNDTDDVMLTSHALLALTEVSKLKESIKDVEDKDSLESPEVGTGYHSNFSPNPTTWHVDVTNEP